MQKRAYLGLGFLLALGIVVLGLFTGGTALAQTIIDSTTVVVPQTGGTTSIPGGGSLTFAAGSVPAGSTATVAELAAPPPGTTLPGVGTVYDFRVTDPSGQPVTSFTGRVTITGTGNACFILNEATGVFEPLQATPIGGGMVECVVPRPGIVAIVTVAAPAPRVVPTPRVPAAPGQIPGQAPGQRPGAPGQTPGRAGAAPGQAPAALPRTGESFPFEALALAGLTLAAVGIATRRFVRA